MKKFIFSLIMISMMIMNIGAVWADVYVPGGSAMTTQNMLYDNIAGKVVGILSALAPLVAFICFIIGVVYMVKKKKVLVGLLIIIIPIILSVILSVINVSMHLMY